MTRETRVKAIRLLGWLGFGVLVWGAVSLCYLIVYP